jgi:carbamoyl-phosphate synthase small subunit
MVEKKKVFIYLANGRVFEGYSFGAEGEVVGELVFNTAMTGYIETLTDPSYYGQIVIQTFPIIGNYGIICEDSESSRPAMSAYIVREFCKMPSNFRCNLDLDTYLKQQGLVGVYGVDTRELTKIVREAGVMNACITSKEEPVKGFEKFKVLDAVKSVSTKQINYYGNPEDKRVVLWDFGEKNNIVRELVKHKCYVIEVPYDFTAEQILALEPKGLMLSNGPGDPAENVTIIKNLKKLIGKLPIFGICLGHQLFALAVDGKTSKMKYGHRGANQPVKNMVTDRVYITSQNHGYEVIADSVTVGTQLYTNVNDGTCEGMDYKDLNAFTVQFHPEACGGPQDTAFLFEKFIDLIEGYYANK